MSDVCKYSPPFINDHSQCQHDPDQIARGIADQLLYVGLDREKVAEAIADALCEYGEAEYKRGFTNGQNDVFENPGLR